MNRPLFRRKDCFITCRDRCDGGGAQIAARISTMIFAKLKGLTYAHSPLADVTHAPPELSTAEWSATWESFFSLGLGEISAAEVEARDLPLVTISKPHRFLPRSQHLYQVTHCHKTSDKNPAAWAKIAPEIRRKYYSTPKPELPKCTPAMKQIAIHLRRGDVGSSGLYSERFTPNDALIGPLTQVIERIGSDRCQLHLFSQGKPADFLPFLQLGAELHLDDDPFLSFHQMVSADVLFTAKSTFSYLAGMIGTGEVIYEPFWHPPLPTWKQA